MLGCTLGDMDGITQRMDGIAYEAFFSHVLVKLKVRTDVELCMAMGDHVSVDCPDAFFQVLKDDLGLSEPDSVSERKRGSHPRCLATVERYNVDAKQTAVWF